ncbi:sigma 54-interacting transcriptional regulator [Desulfofundulus thermocisternus]|uniref:sigma 54-interacting transcriptional regulator n=1 Tax=Desulfofundulus thermocisternus TaxID=42471 RepID=UPI00047FC040|nr:sigma 54-interacting transcriptional regulator [Desulfofundulus thermocisternus]
MGRTRQEELLRAVLEINHHGLIEIDRNGTVLFLNPAMERMLAYGAKEAVGRPVAEIVSCQQVVAALLDVLTSGQSVAVSVVLRGREFLFHCLPVRQGEEVVGAVGEFRDVTPLKRALEQKAAEQETVTLLEDALENIYNGVVVVDRDARVILFNRAYCRFLGLKQEDVLGRPVWEVIENTRMHVVLQTGRAEIEEVQRIKGHDMICSRIPIYKDGRVTAAVGFVMFRDIQELYQLMRRVNQLQSELEYYQGELMRHYGARYSLDDIIGLSPRMQSLKELIRKVARSDSTVLILGESGTGKELFAHALHNASPRRTRPFVRVNCAALPESLLEAELFGYREGAFTGARRGGRIGKFEEAAGGTLFLDEIGEMSLTMQAKLLRVLQEKEIERLGDNRSIEVDVRLVAATNRNLEDMVRRGVFREDLFYRLNVVVLEIPPLRERREDIPLLVEHLLGKLSSRMGNSRKTIHPAALEYLVSYHWPGNVRELENVLERALNVSTEDIITIRDLSVKPLKRAVEDLEKDLICRALEATRGRRMAAAKLLGVGKTTFYEKLNRYNLRFGS